VALQSCMSQSGTLCAHKRIDIRCFSVFWSTILGARNASAVRPPNQVCCTITARLPSLSAHQKASEVTLTGALTHPPPTFFKNDGRRDTATSPPSQFLLFRGLEAGVSEEVLSKGVLKLASPAAPNGASESSLKRVLLVRDRRTNESWRFGFAEFSSFQEAQKAFKAYETMSKFTISSKPVRVSYIHPGVFVPVYNPPEEAERFTFLPLIPVGGGMRLAYWDEEAYVSELVLNPTEENTPNGGEGTNTKEKQGAGGEKKGKKRKAESSAAEKLAAKKAALPAHLQFWQNRHSELHGGRPKTANQSDAAERDEASAAGPASTSEENIPPPPPPQESFVDLNKLACLLCSRQFKTVEKLRQHERVSDLHATNLKNPTLCETARKKLSKNSSWEYRDRAKERREVFGPSTIPPSSGQKKKLTTRPSPAEEPEEPKPNKGAALLGKMGWTQGQGLGASGEGRTEHVVAEMYTAGVGLGMKGAKVGDVEEAVKSSAGGYEEFVRKTKERAKERYGEMG
jgi:RNA-binding protein 5/10